MDKCQWYMTVGYPGGEFAFQDAQLLAKRIGFLLGDFFGPLLNVEKDGNVKYIGAVPCIRPCPPDLAEWLSYPMEYEQTIRANESYQATREKVPGGWLYREWENEFAVPGDPREARGTSWYCAASERIPVRGADGITVLEESNA